MADNTVQWPGKAVSQLSDLDSPAKTLLADLHLLGEEGEANQVGPFAGTPYSLQVITSGASSINKVWSSIVGTAGFGGAIAAFWAAVDQQQVPVKAALAGAAGVVLAATAIAIAVIVSSDVRSRAVASGEQYRARAAVTSVFLRSAASLQCPPECPPAVSQALPVAQASAVDPTLGQALVALASSGKLSVVALSGEHLVTGAATDDSGDIQFTFEGGQVAASAVKGFRFTAGL